MLWKENWESCKERFGQWWKQEGVLLGGPPVPMPNGKSRLDIAAPRVPESLESRWVDSTYRSRDCHSRLGRSLFPGDVLAVASSDVGPGSLATFIGSEPTFMPETVWYEPCISDPDAMSPITFSRDNFWWQRHVELIDAMVALGGHDYMVALPDLIENYDTLDSLRGTEELLTDMLIRPDWVKEQIAVINRIYFEVYSTLYEKVKDDDGGVVFGAFALYGVGRTAKVQCDASAMMSPAQFREFVVPALDEQCRWLEHSMFHLDGSACIPHLEALLEIEALDAIEWTPDPKVPGGGSPAWYDMYRKVLEAGKSLQILCSEPAEVSPVLNALGTHGIYFLTYAQEANRYKAMAREVRRFTG
jgi:hypothetical protein